MLSVFIVLCSINKFKKFHLSWSRVLNYISTVDDIPPSVLQSGKLRDRDRNTIKEKFAVSLAGVCFISFAMSALIIYWFSLVTFFL